MRRLALFIAAWFVVVVVGGFAIANTNSASADALPPRPGFCNVDLDVSTATIKMAGPDKRSARLETEIWCATPSTVIAVPKVTRRGVGRVVGGKPCSVVSPTKCHTVSAFIRGGRIPRKYSYSVIVAYASSPPNFWFPSRVKLNHPSFTSSHCLGYGTPLLECYYTFSFFL